jgi:hypothetical protein
MPPVELFAVGYAMGLVAGEGSFTGDRQQPSLEIRMHRRDMEPLEDVRRVLGGRIFGPYTHGGRPLYVYMLRGRELKAAIPLLQQHLPSCWKRVQFNAWREKYRDYFERAEPSPALLERLHRLLPANS